MLRPKRCRELGWLSQLTLVSILPHRFTSCSPPCRLLLLPLWMAFSVCVSRWGWCQSFGALKGEWQSTWLHSWIKNSGDCMVAAWWAHEGCMVVHECSAREVCLSSIVYLRAAMCCLAGTATFRHAAVRCDSVSFSLCMLLSFIQFPHARCRDALRSRNNLFVEGVLGLSVSLTRPLLCLFDRNFDMASALQHSWTYKPMVWGLLFCFSKSIHLRE